MNRRGARLGIVLGLGAAAGGLFLVDGCSAVLGIGDLPIDGGADGSADAAADRTPADRTSHDRAAPDGSADAGGCVPACSGATPYCLAHACVACKPSSVDCNAAGAPQECNSGGTWVPAPACGASTPFCLAGSCVQCLPGKEPNACVDGGLGFCGDAGVEAVDDCPCANAECQRWPTGKRGDCRFDAGTTTRFDPGVVLDCKSLEIEADATVVFAPDPDGGAVDAAAKWTVIGVVQNAVIDGVILSQEDSLGHGMTAKDQVPSADGGPGEELVYAYVQAEGGAGGSAGWVCAGDFADGGAAGFGNGGGGGGGGLYTGFSSIDPYAGYCPTSCATPTGGGPGDTPRQWRAGGGGSAPEGGVARAEGGAGAIVFGGAGGAGSAPLASAASGGGGGFRGRHGGLLYLRVVGALTGGGRVDLSGQGGGAGGPGMPESSFLTSGGACGVLLTAYTYAGSGSGGGAGGGAGGAFVLRYGGDASTFLSRVDVSGGAGGPTSPGGNGDQQAGQNGAAGAIDAGPIPP